MLCSACGLCLPAKLFRLHADKRLGLGEAVRSECISCTTRRVRRRTYNTRKGELDTLLTTQGGGCALCGRRLSLANHKALPAGHVGAHVDHCHTTGRVRGILCSGCNNGLGKLGDDIPGLEKALAYVKGTASDPRTAALDRLTVAIARLAEAVKLEGQG